MSSALLHETTIRPANYAAPLWIDTVMGACVAPFSSVRLRCSSLWCTSASPHRAHLFQTPQNILSIFNLAPLLQLLVIHGFDHLVLEALELS